MNPSRAAKKSFSESVMSDKEREVLKWGDTPMIVCRESSLPYDTPPCSKLEGVAAEGVVPSEGEVPCTKIEELLFFRRGMSIPPTASFSGLDILLSWQRF